MEQAALNNLLAGLRHCDSGHVLARDLEKQ